MYWCSRLVGPGKREAAAEQILNEYERVYADASNRDWGSVLSYLLWKYPATMLVHFPQQLKHLGTKGKFVWNPLV